ncbi:unnamed protein product [Acanthoscelides obtectus]|uniref:Peptidase C1A papain C-terminal domain-containing protein n=1 Tax=Acanthoscelides obtectus TaxID=200917 RepID=A0A9P0KKE9_ACAOB|nr:unnamed protein product [Acanthoscelides obtectus]CAH2010782.1 unnamed protein product [Acanthoscelides obtectus]CAK1672392.1 Cathepsin L1 (Fragments) [Acanthoscelides obtectus]CAK1672408.1 Cathepsin L1 (Fragments) [Acanthoscelides obtectus]
MGLSGGLMNYVYDYVKDKGIITSLPRTSILAKATRIHASKKALGLKSDPTSMSPFKTKNRLLRMLLTFLTAIHYFVAKVGPISCVIDANYLSSYSHGIIDSTCGCGSGRVFLNHGVLVVGYGEEKGIEYWLVKNSWGADWGDKGYFKLKKDDKNTCGIATDSSYLLV